MISVHLREMFKCEKKLKAFLDPVSTTDIEWIDMKEPSLASNVGQVDV